MEKRRAGCITAAGSGYAPTAGNAALREHFRIETYTLDVNLAMSTISERVVRRESAGTNAATRKDERTANVASPWTEQYLLWTATPYGFLAGASSRSANAATETLLGTAYRVVSFEAAKGGQVRGYVDAENVLERTRTEIEHPTMGTMQLETVYLDWRDYGGIKFPNLIIQKENNQVARILVVDTVEAANGSAEKS